MSRPQRSPNTRITSEMFKVFELMWLKVTIYQCPQSSNRPSWHDVSISWVTSQSRHWHTAWKTDGFIWQRWQPARRVSTEPWLKSTGSDREGREVNRVGWKINPQIHTTSVCSFGILCLFRKEMRNLLSLVLPTHLYFGGRHKDLWHHIAIYQIRESSFNGSIFEHMMPLFLDHANNLKY